MGVTTDILNGLQRDILKSMIDELYRLEEENERLRARNGSVNSNTGNGYDYRNMNKEDALRYIKNEIFGDPLHDIEER